MKKMILALVICSISLSSFAGEEKVSPQVLNAFRTEFNTASEVTWTVGEDYYKAAFLYNNKYVSAYYNGNGELLGLSRYISSNELPLTLQKSLKNKYGNYWIADLFEAAKPSGTSYYITLENADAKIILKAEADGDWTSYQKIRKV